MVARATAETLERPARAPAISRFAVGVAAGLITILGLGLAVFFAVAPVHVVVQRVVPVQQRTGDFDLTLAPTGQTTLEATRVTCLPVQRYVTPGQEQDPACLSRDSSRDRVALAGVAIFVVGAVVWQHSGVERSLLGADR
jgi:hypothetical protein